MRRILREMGAEMDTTLGIEKGGELWFNESTPLFRVFGGFLHHRTRCPKCDYVSHMFNPFEDLSLPLDASTVSVEAALRLFEKTETLDERNMWRCPNCDTKVKAFKQSNFGKVSLRAVLRCVGGHRRCCDVCGGAPYCAQLPQALILHFERFFTVSRDGVEKDDRHIGFSEFLAVNEFLSDTAAEKVCAPQHAAGRVSSATRPFVTALRLSRRAPTRCSSCGPFWCTWARPSTAGTTTRT